MLITQRGAQPDARTIEIVLVEDRSVARAMLARELARQPHINVVAEKGTDAALERIGKSRPDVVVIDTELSSGDVIKFVRELTTSHSLPVIALSPPSPWGCRTAIDALAAGAIDAVSKPGPGSSVDKTAATLLRKVEAARVARIDLLPDIYDTPVVRLSSATDAADRVLLIGAGASGIPGLERVLKQLPIDTPGIVAVVQLPPGMTSVLAARLTRECGLVVKEAGSGDAVTRGRVLLAPGGRHMTLRQTGSRFFAQVKDGPELLHEKPSIDILFNSVAKTAGPNAVGALLAGMGSDGVQGLLAMRTAGAATLAEDESTCIVFDTARLAINCNAAARSVPLHEIAPAMIDCASQRPHYRLAQ